MKIVLKAINISSTLTWYFCMIEKSEELWLILIVHFIGKRNDSANIVLSGTIHDRVSILFIISVSKYSKASCKIKQSVNVNLKIF